MADRKGNPYHPFNFEVDVDGGGIGAGFAEFSGLGTEFEVAEYRAGTDKPNVVQKVFGKYKVSDVTLKRGVINSEKLFDWLKDMQNGDFEKGKRTVTVKMRDEANKNVVQSWTLIDAFPIKYTAPTLNAKGGGDVAMEELTLAVTDIQMSQEA